MVRRLVCLALGLLVLLAVFGTAAAPQEMIMTESTPPIPTATQGSMTITVGDVAEVLAGGVAVVVSVTVSCAPPDGERLMFSQSVAVQLFQASGRAIARGTGAVGGFGVGSLPFACDGTAESVSVTVVADVAGPPFHGGRALASVSGNVCAGLSCGPGCFFDLVCTDGSDASEILMRGR